MLASVFLCVHLSSYLAPASSCALLDLASLSLRLVSPPSLVPFLSASIKLSKTGTLACLIAAVSACKPLRAPPNDCSVQRGDDTPN